MVPSHAAENGTGDRDPADRGGARRGSVRLSGASLAHREAVLRLGTTRAGDFLDTDFRAVDDPELDAVTATIRRWSARYDALVVPSGAGHHIDHTLCAAAGVRLARDGHRVAFYEDRPYAAAMTDDDIAAHMSLLDPRLAPRPVSGPVGTEKHRRLFYPSQFDAYFLDAIAADEGAERIERLWAGPGAEWLPDTPPAMTASKEIS